MPVNGWLRVALLLALVLVSMLYGMVSYSQQLPPYGAVDWLHGTLFDAPPALAAPPDSGDNVPPPIRLTNADDAARMRHRLITLLWGDTLLPARMPSSIDAAHTDPRLRSIAGVERVERLTITVSFGLRSYAYHLVPARPSGRLVIYHTGHDQALIDATAQLAALIAEGHAVLGLEMPLEGSNGVARAQAADGTVRLTTHADFRLLEPARGHALAYFIEPVIVALNHVLPAYGYDDVAMIGLSGGGWTTTLAAAIDPRIRLSFPVAGTYPRYLRRSASDRGDWEQRVPEVYDVAGYHELYVLGAHGSGRRQLQILNTYDPCCFGGQGWETYIGSVSAAVERLGDGEFDVFADDSHRQHAISDAALRRILLELAQ